MKTNFFIIFAIIITSCQNGEKILPDIYYNVPISEINNSEYRRISDYFSEYTTHGIDTYQNKRFSYTEQAKNLRFNTSHLEIEFDQIERGTLMFNILICMKKINGISFCAYIIWKKDFVRDCMINWFINSKTDTIFTNISDIKIHELFPNFQGVCLDGKIKKVILNYSHEINSSEFYNNIVLEGFVRN
ncbi:MAG: hypothetical protein NT007_02805 [Candidatus Kapabacteria bacterium]|nr:hypothetical protein [Candidatus Kapabacteria bacterium]